MNKLTDIYENEARKYIIRLINFFGSIKIEKCLEKYRESLTCAGPIYKRYYLINRHPWWDALIHFYELESKGKSINKHLDLRLKLLAGAGKKISVLQKMMPDSVRDKFKRDLLDKNRAHDFLFELNIAWHFLTNGHSLSWYEKDSCPDLLVKTLDFDFNVECKRVTVDGSRKVWRKDFYRLVEKLLPKVEKLNYKGKIDVELNDRLHSSDQHLEALSNQLLELIRNKRINGDFELPFGNAVLDLAESNGDDVDFKEKYQEMLNRKSHEAQGVIYASERNGKPVDSIELTLKSKKSDKVLEGIKNKIKYAAKKQLPTDKPGLISCFLEDISDLKNLANDSGLQILSNYLLNKKELSHVAAISFSAEGRVQIEAEAENFNSQGLLFRNPNCIYEKIHDFPFLSKEIEVAEQIN
ncbi:hypothetical protein ACOHYD_13735 [Desulfobacterota bacterium M19]